MMVPRKSLILAGAALALLGASSSAQSQSGKVFARYNKPLRTVSLDLATGTVTKGPAVHNKATGTETGFDNIDLGGFVGVDTGSCFCEWFDAGIKISPNGADLMNDIVFAYCGALLSPVSGGPGGSVKLGFYEGYNKGPGVGNPPNGTAVALFTLTGLPANTGSSSFFGGFRCFFIQVTFGSLICFADGFIGYSWKFLDVGVPGLYGLAGTWPFLSCVQSCTGPGPDGLSMTDCIDQYCPPGTLRTTFSFGTTPFGGYFTSMSMRIDEIVCPATTGLWVGDSVNEDTLSAQPAIVGASWTATITSVNSHGTMGPISVTVKGNTLNGPTFASSLGGRLNEFLLKNPTLIKYVGSHNGATGTVTEPQIPAACALLGVTWAAQGTIVGGGFGDLTTAVTGVIGTN